MAEATYLAGLEDVWRSGRLIFRAIQAEDYEFFFNHLDTDPINLTLATPMTLRPTRKKKAEEWFEDWKKHDYLADVMICLRLDVESNKEYFSGDAASCDEPKPIGMLTLAPGVYGRDARNRACNLGVSIASPYQNKGLGTEAVTWALDWAFRRVNMHSVHLGSIEYNKRAHKCYQKCGFKYDGRRRQCHFHDRKWYDLYVFSIIEDEWEEMRKGAQ